MKTVEIIETRLLCTQCGNMQIIHRNKGKRKPYGHLKRLWCYKCKERTNHFEICDEMIEEAKDEY